MFADLYVHQIVCLTFHGPRPFEDAVVRHLDDNPANNHPDNLVWGSYQDNANDYWSNEELVFMREERKALRSRDEASYVPDVFLGF